LNSDTVTCRNCGSEVRAGMRFCSQCGRVMNEESPPQGTAGSSGVVLSGESPIDSPSHDEWSASLSRGETDLFGTSADLRDEREEGRGTPTQYIPPAQSQRDRSQDETQAYTPPPRFSDYTLPPQAQPALPAPPRYDDRAPFAPPPPRYAGNPAAGPIPPAPIPTAGYPVPLGYAPMGGFQCPYCRTTVPPVARERVSQTGWIVLVVLILTCFPLFWIGLIIKEPYRVCRECGNTLS
jgi:hypothetical protein